MNGVLNTGIVSPIQVEFLVLSLRLASGFWGSHGLRPSDFLFIIFFSFFSHHCFVLFCFILLLFSLVIVLERGKFETNFHFSISDLIVFSRFFIFVKHLLSPWTGPSL